MPRDKGTLDAILAAIVARLIDEIPDLCNPATCFESLDPWGLPAPNPGNMVFVVAPMSGEFDAAYLEGGGQEQATANTGVTVAIHSPVVLDEPRRDTHFLRNSTHGVLQVARRVLAALTDWTPKSPGGLDELTRDPLMPAGYVFQRNDRAMGAMGVQFALSFDWDLDVGTP